MKKKFLHIYAFLKNLSSPQVYKGRILALIFLKADTMPLSLSLSLYALLFTDFGGTQEQTWENARALENLFKLRKLFTKITGIFKTL